VLAPLWSEEEKQVLVYGASFVFELFVLKKWCFGNITPCLEKLAGGRVVLYYDVASAAGTTWGYPEPKMAFCDFL